MASNYPPGVTDSMLPGNSDRDSWIEELWEMVDEEIVDAYESDPYWKAKVDSIISDYNEWDDEAGAVAQAIESFYWENVPNDDDDDDSDSNNNEQQEED